jgi:hypothetical protein
LLTKRLIAPLARLRNRRRRELTRAEIDKLIELGCPGGSDLDKLGWLLRWIFGNSPDSHEAMIARARRRGIRPDRAARLLSGDVAFGFRWDVIEDTVKDCGAPPAAVEIAHDLFHDFARLGSLRMGPAGRSQPGPAATHRRDDSERPPARMRPDKWTGQNCSVLRTDVVGFGATTRTDQDRIVIREAMYRIVRGAFAAAGISRDDYRDEDRGDGILIVISPDVPPKQIIHRLLPYITEKLSRYNADAEDGTRFKLRVAMHVGPVESDAEGVNGQVIIDAARLIEAPVFKQRLANAPQETCLGFIASRFVYDSVIKQHPGQLAPATYQKISGHVKEHRFTAWINLAPDVPKEADPQE